MAGIAGINKGGERLQVEKMLATLSHRGGFGTKVIETSNYTIGIVWSETEDESVRALLETNQLQDGPGYGQAAVIEFRNGSVKLLRDALGVIPLFYTLNGDSLYGFASEAKALSWNGAAIHLLPPGHTLERKTPVRYVELSLKNTLKEEPAIISEKLLDLLLKAVSRRINNEQTGIWLSGGLCSGTLAALANPFLSRPQTFTVGVKGSPDLEYASSVARVLGTRHHEVVITLDDMIRSLPEVIYHLETFNMAVVRNGILNYALARATSDVVSEVISGEGANALLAGYRYLNAMPAATLDVELLSILQDLHLTAFQRVDRCSSAAGLRVHLVFADPEVVDFGLRIPSTMKLHSGVDKWILRQTMDGMLPAEILKRPAAGFWEGAGAGDQLADYLGKRVTDHDFRTEKKLENGWEITTREELYYYRLFREYFPSPEHFAWIPKTLPRQNDMNRDRLVRGLARETGKEA
jgi:asparagine synthase (glutamine-hydrolysing)